MEQTVQIDGNPDLRVGDRFTTNQTGEQLWEITKLEPGRIGIKAVAPGPLVGKVPMRY